MDHMEAGFVVGFVSYDGGEAFNGFEVVCHHIGLRVCYGMDEGFVAQEVGDQHFDGGLGVEMFHLFDRLCPVCCSAVGQVISVDGGDHGVVEFEMLDGLCHVEGFFGIGGHGFAGLGGAESAAPGTHIAEDHKGGGTGFPAFGLVRAATALADGMELAVLKQLLEFNEFFPTGDTGFEPVGFPFRGGVVVLKWC